MRGNNYLRGFVPVLMLVIFGIAIGLFAIGFALFRGSETKVPFGNFVGKEGAWTFDNRDGTWKATGDPPACPDPLIVKPPVDINQVSSILYPGQVRGGDYKPHGGFRFIKNDNLVDVVIPMDAYLVQASRHLARGEIQYLMFFVNDCGVMYKLDHLRTLTDKYERVFDDFPPPPVEDSRTTEINPRVFVQQGELIATEIGFEKDKNVFLDFGLYDLRQKNETSQDPSWIASHPGLEEQGEYALCWLNNFKPQQAEILANLPIGSVEGNASDYCD